MVGRSSEASKDRLLKPTEVAAKLRVDPKTVARWAKAGRITSIRTPGGHRRYRESEIEAIATGTFDQDKDREHE